MPSEHHARVFLEGLVWSEDRYCPHCGSVRSVRLRGDRARPGLYQCREGECRRQFTVTTKTPLHGTRLDLRLWVCAMVLVLTSSKGLSSVVMAHLLGVNQKTAWKMSHAIRELMDDRHGEYPLLQGEIEVDEGYLGGAPKSLAGAAGPQGPWHDAPDGAGPYRLRWPAVIATLRRAPIGVYHTLSAPHLQSYVDEVVWSWNHRGPAGEKRVQRIGRSGRVSTKTTTIWKPIPVVGQMRLLLQGAVGRQVRRSACFGLRWP